MRFATVSTPAKANRSLCAKLGNESTKKFAVTDASVAKRMDKVANYGVEAQT